MLYLIRHGDRLDYTKQGANKFKKSKRYKNNPHDTPLSASGKKEIRKLSKNVLPENIDYIYSSPMTRCIETSIEIINTVNSKAKIRIEYGLAEDVFIPQP